MEVLKRALSTALTARSVNAKPLADSNLFKSFADLGARGDHFPEAAMLRWVRRHGLLRLKDLNEDKGSLDNQEPLTVSAFREEARLAYEALTLFEAIHSENCDLLRQRITREQLDPPGRPGEGKNADVFLDGRKIPMVLAADSELSDYEVLLAARIGLERFLKSSLSNVSLDFDHYSGHPRPEEVYRPRLVSSVPDLYSAIWFQFALLMTDARPVKFCVICEGPIFRPRRDQKTCSDKCRKGKSCRK